jgi:hypothetical protein
LKEPSCIHSYVVKKQGRVLSSFAEYAIGKFRQELKVAAELNVNA